jgi:hypothetical protein
MARSGLSAAPPILLLLHPPLAHTHRAPRSGDSARARSSVVCVLLTLSSRVRPQHSHILEHIIFKEQKSKTLQQKTIWRQKGLILIVCCVEEQTVFKQY